MEIVQTEGERQVTREIEVYNLDAVIAVGYRVNSIKATHLVNMFIDFAELRALNQQIMTMNDCSNVHLPMLR